MLLLKEKKSAILNSSGDKICINFLDSHFIPQDNGLKVLCNSIRGTSLKTLTQSNSCYKFMIGMMLQ